MIVLDTNVVSEPLKPHGSPKVIEWLNQQVAETLFLTTVSLAELQFGAEILPNGKRKAGLVEALRTTIDRIFGPRILPFDQSAARLYAPMVGEARRRGVAVDFADGQIASIAGVHGFAVATRDVGPFQAVGVRVINPWLPDC